METNGPVSIRTGSVITFSESLQELGVGRQVRSPLVAHPQQAQPPSDVVGSHAEVSGGWNRRRNKLFEKLRPWPAGLVGTLRDEAALLGRELDLSGVNGHLLVSPRKTFHVYSTATVASGATWAWHRPANLVG